MKRHSRHFSGTVRTALFLSVAALAVTACSRQSASGTRPVAAAMASVAAEGTSVTRLDPGLDTVISPGTVVEKVAGDFQFVEGPLWHNGEVWFADLVGNKLYAAASDGKARIIIDKSGGLQETAPGSYQGSNGMAVDKDGTVLMAQHGLRRIARVGPDMKVTAVVELRARFDEERNIHLATRLQEAGATVAYGVVGFKTHAKMLLIVRREGNSLRRYVHLGTGNYHTRTTRQYTDFSFLTAGRRMGEDVHNLFLQLTGPGKVRPLRKLLQAPFTLHDRLTELIDAEIAHAKAGEPGRIVGLISPTTPRQQ